MHYQSNSVTLGLFGLFTISQSPSHSTASKPTGFALQSSTNPCTSRSCKDCCDPISRGALIDSIKLSMLCLATVLPMPSIGEYNTKAPFRDVNSIVSNNFVKLFVWRVNPAAASFDMIIMNENAVMEYDRNMYLHFCDW